MTWLSVMRPSSGGATIKFPRSSFSGFACARGARRAPAAESRGTRLKIDAAEDAAPSVCPSADWKARKPPRVISRAAGAAVLGGPPEELEIGFGLGELLLERARNNPGTRICGIDVRWAYVERVREAVRDLGVPLPNLFFVHAEGKLALQSWLDEASLSNVIVYFPDPWFKKRHAKRRIMNAEVASLIARALKPGGVLHVAAALLFVVAAALSLHSLLGPHPEGRVDDALSGIWLFGTNVQFILPLGAVTVISIAGLVRPKLLEHRQLYVVAGALLLLLALCPLARLTADGTGQPLPKSHYHTRMAAGVVLAAIAITVWIYAMRPAWMPNALATLSRAANGWRLLLFAFVGLLAAVPADLQLTELWRRSMSAFQETIAARSGLIPIEETPFGRKPYSDMVENWALVSQSLVMRRATGNGIVVPPKDFKGWQFLDAHKRWITNVDRFLWDDGR